MPTTIGTLYLDNGTVKYFEYIDPTLFTGAVNAYIEGASAGGAVVMRTIGKWIGPIG